MSTILGDPTGEQVDRLLARVAAAERDLAPILAVAEAQRAHWRRGENAITYTMRVLSECK